MGKKAREITFMWVCFSIGYFLMSYVVFNNDRGLTEALVLSGIAGGIFAVLMSLWTYIAAKRKKSKKTKTEELG